MEVLYNLCVETCKNVCAELTSRKKIYFGSLGIAAKPWKVECVEVRLPAGHPLWMWPRAAGCKCCTSHAKWPDRLIRVSWKFVIRRCTWTFAHTFSSLSPTFLFVFSIGLMQIRSNLFVCIRQHLHAYIGCLGRTTWVIQTLDRCTLVGWCLCWLVDLWHQYNCLAGHSDECE